MARWHDQFSRLRPAILGLVLVLSAARGQSPQTPQAPLADPKADLGRALFFSPQLSTGGKTSCSTCHDPEKSFTDGRADSRGQLDIGIGRNSPTMFAIGQVERFRDPRQAELAAPGRRPKVMSLEERCLAPMENELEMSASVASVVKALRTDKTMNEKFDHAFAGTGTGVTKDRLAQALAAYLRTLDPPTTPYAAFLQGKQDALTEVEKRGLAAFSGKGACGSCHSGSALSDGLMHVVDPPGGQRIQDRVHAATERKIALIRREYEVKKPGTQATMSVQAMMAEAEKRRDLPGGGGYDPAQLEVQTTTLWDVARTGPYFRDGSAATLKDAVSQHVSELRTVAARKDEVKKTLAELDRGGKRSPIELRVSRESTVPKQIPGELSGQEIDDIVVFLKALSPR